MGTTKCNCLRNIQVGVFSVQWQVALAAITTTQDVQYDYLEPMCEGLCKATIWIDGAHIKGEVSFVPNCIW